MVILAFGRPEQQTAADGTINSGSIIYNNSFATTVQIRAAVEAFAGGYWSGLAGDRTSFLQIVVGTTNNDPGDTGVVSPEHAAEWGRMVNNLQDWLEDPTRLYNTQMAIHGGSDMELDWNDPQTTRAWTDAYLAASNQFLYNFGDAAGCPPGGGDCGTQNYPDWTTEDVWYISGGALGTRVGPQIYRRDGINAQQWQQIKLYPIQNNQRRIFIEGVLTQYDNCQENSQNQQFCSSFGLDNTSNQGWTQLWLALQADSRTRQQIPFLTDIESAVKNP